MWCVVCVCGLVSVSVLGCDVLLCWCLVLCVVGVWCLLVRVCVCVLGLGSCLLGFGVVV